MTTGHFDHAGFRRVGSRQKHSVAAIRRGVDSQGRFIGNDAVERGLRYFWNSRRATAFAPIARDFDCRASDKPTRSSRADTPSIGSGRAGIPRPSRTGITPACLLRIDALRHAGRTLTSIAQEVGFGLSAVHYHLRLGGSASMRAARLAAARASA